MLGLINIQSHHHGPKAGADVVGLHQVAGLCVAEVIYNEQECLEVGVPQVKVEE